MVGNYIHSVSYADQAIERFFQDLEKAGVLDDTVVVLYGDHDGHLKRKQRDTKAIDQLLDVPEDERRLIGKGSVVLDRVPLLIRLPGGAHASVVEAIGGQVDVTPTVLHLLGVQDDGTLPLIARTRVEKAATIYHQGVAPWMIFTGRHSLMTETPHVVSEAMAMAVFTRTASAPIST